MNKRIWAMATVAAVVLTACGGGSDSSTPTPAPGPTTVKFSGVAATGAPLIGSVTVKDAKGATKTVLIGENGKYEVDVTGMTGPFVFRAEGTVGGRTTVVHSAATDADANKIINITQLTDLVVANIAGQLAANYFNSGNFSSLTAPQLDAEVAGLKAKLLPMLEKMGVESGIDLLRSSFSPLSSALDKALDILRVDVDGAQATITNLVTQQQLQDDLSVKAAQEADAPKMAGDGMETAADDLTAIRKVLADFMALFATAPATDVAIGTYLVNGSPRDASYGFRFEDETAAQFSAQLAADPSMVGGSFTDVVFRKVDYKITNDNAAPRAWVDFTHKDKNGVLFSRQANFQLVKGTDGVWRLRGNGRVLATYGVSLAVSDAVNNCVSTGLEFGIEDVNGRNSSAAVYAIVKGPGLPEAGLKYVRPSNGGYWTLANAGAQNGQRMYRMATSCQNLANAGLTDAIIAAIPASSVYSVTGYTSEGAVATITDSTFEITTNERIQSRPLTLAEAMAATYPQITTSADLANYTGGNLTISATQLNAAVATQIALTLSGSSGSSADQVDISTTKTGTASTSFDLPTPTGGVTRREVRVGSMDSGFRELITVMGR